MGVCDLGAGARDNRSLAPRFCNTGGSVEKARSLGSFRDDLLSRVAHAHDCPGGQFFDV